MVVQESLSFVKSLLPRDTPKVCEAPRVGSHAPGGLSIPSGYPTIVAFVRHCGCPFAAKEVQDLGKQVRKYPNLRVIIVQHSEEQVTNEWFKVIGGPAAFGYGLSRVSLVSDPGLKIYAAWGVGALGWAGLLFANGLFKLKKLADEGFSTFTSDGSWRWQGSAGFALDASSIIRWKKVAKDAGDMCDYAAAARSLVT